MDITVVIPVYKAESFLRNAVASAFMQPEVSEVILVEDGSPDESLRICRTLAMEDGRVRLFQHPDGVNRGAGASRNLGISKATKPYIAFLDADDRFLPDRFASERTIFPSVPDADGVYNAIGTNFLDTSGREAFERTFGYALTTVKKSVEPEQLFDGLTGGINDFGHFSLDGVTLKREALNKITPWFNPDLRLHQDTEFLIRSAHHCRLYPGQLIEPVAERGVHEGNRITNNEARSWTRYMLYASLYRWAKQEGIAGRALEHFLYRSSLFRLKGADTFVQRITACSAILAHPQLFAKQPLREAFLGCLFGHESWTTRKLSGLVWRVFGQTEVKKVQ